MFCLCSAHAAVIACRRRHVPADIIMTVTEQRYSDGAYWSERLDEISAFKVSLALRALDRAGVTLHEGLEAVEIGCGNGAFLFPLHEALSERLSHFRVTGCDIASSAIRRATLRAQDFPRLSFAECSVRDLEGHFAIGFLMDVLEHVRDPITMLEDARQHCDILVIHLPIEHSVAHAILRRPTASHNTFCHIHFYSLETAQIMLQEAGFQIEYLQFTAASPEILSLAGSAPLRIMRWIRYFAYKIAPRVSLALMGGSILVIATPR